GAAAAGWSGSVRSADPPALRWASPVTQPRRRPDGLSSLNAERTDVLRPRMLAAVNSDAGSLVSLADIRAAAVRIQRVVLRSPVIALPHPSDPHRLLHCTAESPPRTRARKLRGAHNTHSQVLDTAREKGIVGQSTGNHDRAVAWVAGRLDLQATIVMPEATPRPKLEAVRALGARVEIAPKRERDERAVEVV